MHLDSYVSYIINDLGNSRGCHVTVGDFTVKFTVTAMHNTPYRSILLLNKHEKMMIKYKIHRISWCQLRASKHEPTEG